MAGETDDGSEVSSIYMSRANDPSIGIDRNWIIAGATISVIFCLVLTIYCTCRRKRRRRRIIKKKRVKLHTETDSPQISIVPVREQVRTAEDVARRYERSISTLSSKSQVYLVPFDALPANFDFSSRDVEVKADYVILKDLGILNSHVSSLSSNGIVNEAYERQEPYNPNMGQQSSVYYPSIPKEGYQKQAPYNPNFY